MDIKGIIFDLDGTLVNSIEDIADSMNAVLEAFHYPTHSYAKYTTFIGSGIRNLVLKALPKTVNSKVEIGQIFAAMLSHYKDNCTHKTFVYEGILGLLDRLAAKDIKLAILSNKADALTKKVAREKLPAIFEPVVGLTTEKLKKPNPEVVLKICKKLDLPLKNTLYVGDSVIDIETAKNAGLKSIAVCWGFQSKEALLAKTPDYIISSPQELLDIIF